MKFMHLGDLHLGKTLFDFSLIEDQKFILDQIVKLAVDRSVDAMLIAGDVYDKAIPSEEAVSLLDDFLVSLSKNHIKVFMISGNHDSDERLNFGSSFFRSRDVYISAKFDGKLYKHSESDEFGPVNIYLLPFVKASQVRHFFPDEDIQNYDDAVRTVIEHGDIDSGERNILIAHQFVTAGGKDPEMSGSESAGTQNVGLVEKIGAANFDSFDYTALGHIHSPQPVGRENIRYSGSPMKYSLSEINHVKSVPIITLGKKGQVDIELAELKPMRDLRHIKGKMDRLLLRENIVSPNDFIYVTLTDDEMVNDAMGIFQQYYPNTLKIDYDNAHSKEMQQVDITAVTENKSFDQLISEFYFSIYKTEMSEEEMKIMMEVAREAGVVDEAD